MADPPARRFRDPRTRWVIVAAALLLLAAAYVVMRRRGKGGLFVRPRSGLELNVHREPATPAERALLAPLTEGSAVGDWRITLIEGLREGYLHVLLRRDADSLEVVIVRREGTSVSPPVTEGAYALFHFGLSTLDLEAMSVMRALAARLRSNASAPVPAGLRPFVPRDGR